MKEKIEIHQFSKYRAMFTPKKLEDLRESNKKFIGSEIRVTCNWFHDDGVYADQWVFSDLDQQIDGWIPHEDLEILDQLPQ